MSLAGPRGNEALAAQTLSTTPLEPLSKSPSAFPGERRPTVDQQGMDAPTTCPTSVPIALLSWNCPYACRRQHPLPACESMSSLICRRLFLTERAAFFGTPGRAWVGTLEGSLLPFLVDWLHRTIAFSDHAANSIGWLDLPPSPPKLSKPVYHTHRVGLRLRRGLSSYTASHIVTTRQPRTTNVPDSKRLKLT